MENKDEYVFFKREDGTVIYYKNKQLHREDGPAIVPESFANDYSKIVDKNLYKEIFEADMSYKFSNSKTVFEKPSEKEGNPFGIVYARTFFKVPAHYLEGQYYTEENFNKIKLKEQMENDLLQSSKSNKKLKI